MCKQGKDNATDEADETKEKELSKWAF